MQCFGCIQISDIWMSFDYTELNFVFHRYETFFTIMEDLGSMPLASLLVHSISTTCCWMNYYQGSVIPSTSTKLSRIKSKTQVNSLLVSTHVKFIFLWLNKVKNCYSLLPLIKLLNSLVYMSVQKKMVNFECSKPNWS